MELKPEYRPDESDAVIFSEHTWLQGAFLATIAYGMSVVLFAMTVYLLQKHKKRKNSKKHTALTIYVSILFVLSSVYQGTLQEWTQLSFIDWRNFPGGPSEFQDVMFSMPVDMGANTTLVISNWFCDIINVRRAEPNIYASVLFLIFDLTGLEVPGHLQRLRSSHLARDGHPRLHVLCIHG
jgi:Ni/Fe-hydrogenase subunit HybB-like protein